MQNTVLQSRLNFFKKIAKSTLFVSFLAFVAALLLLPTASKAQAERVVSLAPSITETVFMLGRGHSLVGVTRYCDFPEAAKSLPSIGGLADTNYELLLRLKPTLVIGHPENSQVLDYVEAFGVKTLRVPHESLEDIFASVETIGKSLNALEEATKFAQSGRRMVKNLLKKKPGP